MRLRWLGWAGAELEADGATVVIDPLEDAGAVFAPLGERAAGTPVPRVVPPTPAKAVAGLVTHLHRDHTDASALTSALVPGAPLFEPPPGGGDSLEQLALTQADQELAASGLERRPTAPWESATAGRFTVTALPACDGIGDPQVSWLVEGDGRAGPAPRRHDVPRLVVADGPPPRALRRGAGAGERRGADLSPPPAGESAARRARPGSGGDRRADPRRPPGDSDSRGGLRGRGDLRARGRRRRSASQKRPPTRACRSGSSSPGRRSRSRPAPEALGELANGPSREPARRRGPGRPTPRSGGRAPAAARRCPRSA